MIQKTILVTGGAGYIGSHTVVQLLEEGYELVIVDNMDNSHPNCLKRVKQITGKDFKHYEIDLRNETELDKLFSDYNFWLVVHFAGKKAVGESVQKPLLYYENNISGSLNLFKVMQKHNVKNIVFSSSATVYGDPASVPIKEDFPLSTTNPYGSTKLMIEQILGDVHVSDNTWNIAILRYFNPVGSHPSGLIGEDPQGIPNNLMPFISQVAVGKRDKLSVFGNDYTTKDGTGVRDYLHVVDLAAGHIAAVQKLEKENIGLSHYNLGTGTGYSVLEMVKAFEEASGIEIKFQIVDRRAGDIAECYADPSKAAKELGWRAEKGIKEMCESSWNWQSKNPNGYKES